MDNLIVHRTLMGVKLTPTLHKLGVDSVSKSDYNGGRKEVNTCENLLFRRLIDNTNSWIVLRKKQGCRKRRLSVGFWMNTLKELKGVLTMAKKIDTLAMLKRMRETAK